MPIQLSGSLVITGSITTTGVITMSGSIASASYSSTSDLLQGTGSVGFTTTASFNAVSSSQQQVSASYIALSASYNTFSGSASTRITVDSASLLQVSSSQQQISASLLNVISIFATTGSNSFRATQSITGSLTVTGQIIAQTLNVQQVTSSIVYSSGSNIFGCDLNSRQTFTGSVLVTGSLTIAGGGNVSAPTIFGSTIACSPIGCFATSCATAFIGGTMSGTTIYGSTAVCSPVGKFTTCLDLGGALTGTSAIFSSTITGTTIYGSTMVCAASLKAQSGFADLILCGSNTTSPHIGGTFVITTNQDALGRTIIGNSAVGRAMYFEAGGTFTFLCAATFNSSVASPYYSFTGAIPSSTACTGYIDYSSATTRFFSVGTSGATKGAFSFYAKGADDSSFIPLNITSGGNVGIGAVSPDATLHICCSAGSANALLAHFQNSGGGTAIATIKIGEGIPEGQYGVLGHYGADNSFRIGSVNGNLAFHAGASTACGTNLYGMCERLTILTSGDVGIGISAPTALLHLSSHVAGASNSLFIQNSCTTGTGAKIIFAPNSNFGVNDNAAAIASCSTAGGYDVDLVFTTYKSAVGPIERMRITGGTGAVTTQCQPFVYGGLACDQTICSISNPTKVNFVVNTGHFQRNISGCWSNANYNFSAPVTGVYLVNISGYWNANNLINQFAAFVNCARKVSIPTAYCTNIAGGSMMVPLTAGETLDFRVYNDVGTGTLYSNVYHTFFSIYLLG